MKIHAQSVLIHHSVDISAKDAVISTLGDLLTQNNAKNPDIHWINEAGESISIAEVRTIITATTQKPFQDGNQYFIFLTADKLTQEAQQALLKTLEEPPTHTYIILATSFPEKLLSTILSRCTKIQSPPEQQKTKILDIELPTTYFEAINLAEKHAKTREDAVAFCMQLLHQFEQQMYTKPSLEKTSQIHLVIQAIQRLQRNTNTKLALESLLFQTLANRENFV